MYLARLSHKRGAVSYVIRQSYDDGRCYRSRDLFDLGDDPARWIVYPGGNGFYIHTDVEDTIADKGVTVSQIELEPLFFPFLRPHIRRVIDGFDRGEGVDQTAGACLPADAVHRFDRYRLHFLKLGRIDHRGLECVPDRFYSGLHAKSRDEIEHDFIAAERILHAGEIARYTYEIFDLQRHFSENFARRHPEWIDQERLDRVFIEALCRLNGDAAFWQGCDRTAGLQPHLVRYAIMFFDYAIPLRDPFQEFLRDFMNRHRILRPPQSVQVNLAESARLFGVSAQTLKNMSCRELTRRYRRLAQRHHPDKGGDPETFVKLSAAYDKQRKRKSGK
jgi:hypothetical protein